MIGNEEIMKFVEDHQIYPHCKVDEYFKFKKVQDKKIPYAPVSAKKQIPTIIKSIYHRPGSFEYNQLFQVLSKHINLVDYPRLVKYVINGDHNDLDIYYKIREIYNEYMGKKETLHPKSKNIRYRKCSSFLLNSEDIAYHLKPFFKNTTNVEYLDLGCGQCIKTKMVGEILDIPDKNTYGADIESWGEYKDEIREKNINFIGLQINEPFPIESNKFDLVTALMVLHHVENLDLFLRETNRILKKGGIFFIKEHDAMTNFDKMLIDIEHGLYEVTMRNNSDYFNSYYGVYYDKIEWSVIIEKYGFEYIHTYYYYPSVYENIVPTRYYFGIYRKINNIS